MQAVSEALAKAGAGDRPLAWQGQCRQLRRCARYQAHGRFIDAELERKVHAALVAAGEHPEGWQRWAPTRCAKTRWPEPRRCCVALMARPWGGRKMQGNPAPAARAVEAGRPGRTGQPWTVESLTMLATPPTRWSNPGLEPGCRAPKGRAPRAAHGPDEEVTPPGRQVRRRRLEGREPRPANWFGAAARGGHVSEKVFAELQPLWKAGAGAALRRWRLRKRPACSCARP